MGRFQILIYFLTFFLLSSCCIPVLQKKFYRTEYGWERPIKSSFTLNKKVQNSNDSIIEGVYIYTKNKHDIFYRFFNNNKFITSGFNSKNNISDQLNNLKKGHVGYYQIEEDLVFLEYFSVGAHDCGKYHRYELKIIGDSIVGYQKLKIEGLTGTPDW